MRRSGMYAVNGALVWNGSRYQELLDKMREFVKVLYVVFGGDQGFV